MARVKVCPSCGEKWPVSAMTCGKCREELPLNPVDEVINSNAASTHDSESAEPRSRDGWESRTRRPALSFDRLPPPLNNRFEIIQELLPRGGQAVVYLVIDHSHDGRECVLKLYDPRVQLRPEVLRLLKQKVPEHVVTLIDADRVGDQWYEILEYLPAGSLRGIMDEDFRQVPGDQRKLPDHIVRKILQEVNAALTHVHAVSDGSELVHRDLKPENILIRRRVDDRHGHPHELDLVLADFALASVRLDTSRQVSQSNAATLDYAAPEFALGKEFSKACDYWSLGIIVFEALVGRHPFHDLETGRPTIPDFFNRLHHRVRADLSEVPATWKPLVGGLLTYSPKKRFGSGEIEKWLLDPHSVMIPIDDFADAGGDETQDPYNFGERSYHSVRELAAALSENWTRARGHFEQDPSVAKGGFLRRWISNLRGHEELALFMRSLDKEDGANDNLKLFRLINRMDPSLPPRYIDEPVTPESLWQLALKAIGGNRKATNFLHEVFQQRVLSYYRNERDELPLSELQFRWASTVEDYQLLVDSVPVESETKTAAKSDTSAVVFSLACSLKQEGLDTLRKVVGASVSRDALRCEWIARFGSISRASVPELLVMIRFAAEAEAATIAVRQRRAAARRDQLARVRRLGWAIAWRGGAVLLLITAFLKRDDLKSLLPDLSRASSMGGLPLLARGQASICENGPRAVGVDERGQDTHVGSVYQKQSRASSATLRFGGWGDQYFDYLQFSLTNRAKPDRAKSYLCLFVVDLPRNDPNLVLSRVTQRWYANRLTYGSRPPSIPVGAFGKLDKGWNAVDVTPIVSSWVRGEHSNFGIALSPRQTEATNGSFASGNYGDRSLRPRLIWVATETIQRVDVPDVNQPAQQTSNETVPRSEEKPKFAWVDPALIQIADSDVAHRAASEPSAEVPAPIAATPSEPPPNSFSSRYVESPRITVTTLTRNDLEPELFPIQSETFPFPMETVLQATVAALKGTDEKNVTADNYNSVISTSLTRHGIIGFPTFTRYVIALRPSGPNSTDMHYRFLAYWMKVEKDYRTTTLMPETNARIMDKRRREFITKVRRQLNM